MIIYTHVREGHEPVAKLDPCWQQWPNQTLSDRDMIENMAVQKFLRERGGLAPDETRLEVQVWSFFETTPRHDTGRPMMVHNCQMIATRQPEPDAQQARNNTVWAAAPEEMKRL